MRQSALSLLVCVLWRSEVCNGFTSSSSLTTKTTAHHRTRSPWCLNIRNIIRGKQSKFGWRASEEDLVDSILNADYVTDDDVSKEEEEATEELIKEDIFKYFEGTEEEDAELDLVEFVLEEHKPLGCTAEESVAIENVDTKKGSFHHVFVAKVVEGGNAEKAGLQPGDVIVGLSGSFDEVMDVIGIGLDKVRSLVSGREETKSLVIRAVRNSNVMSQHESALIDLCTLDGASQKELNNCLNTIMSNELLDSEVAPQVEDCDEELDDAECMLETMFEAWVDETPGARSATSDEEEKEEEKEVKKKVAPWSSRSSPSGTYVRDPATGKMKNIDAQ